MQSVPTQQTENICITFIQCWTNVEDVGPTLYKCYTSVLCLLGICAHEIVSVTKCLFNLLLVLVVAGDRNI